MTRGRGVRGRERGTPGARGGRAKAAHKGGRRKQNPKIFSCFHVATTHQSELSLGQGRVAAGHIQSVAFAWGWWRGKGKGKKRKGDQRHEKGPHATSCALQGRRRAIAPSFWIGPLAGLGQAAVVGPEWILPWCDGPKASLCGVFFACTRVLVGQGDHAQCHARHVRRWLCFGRRESETPKRPRPDSP